MSEALVLTDDLRKELKEPLGRILQDMDELETRDIIICVGDETSDRFLCNDLEPKICIYDNKIKRKNILTAGSIKDFDARQISIENPPGQISKEAFSAIREALSSDGKTKIKVDGEEDLLTLVAIKLAPNNSLVLYGQPDEGLVVVDVDEKTKEKVENILERMKDED